MPVLPAFARMAGNAKILATVLSDAPSHSFGRAFPDVDVRALRADDLMDELLADWRPETETAILSAENFRPNHAARLRGLLEDVARVTVVLFVRAQDRWVESYYNQLTKTRDIQQSPTEFVDSIIDPDTDRLCCPDWWSHFQTWRETFGNCQVVLYDEVKSDLFGAFFKAAGLSSPSGIPEIARQQESLDLHQLVYLTALDHGLSFDEFAQRRAASAEASRRLGAPSARILSLADFRRLSDRFASSNARLLETLHRPIDDPALCLVAPRDEPMTRDEVLASEPYQRHHTIADEIHAAAVTS